MSELIACIPNFSEARRPEVVHAIVKAMTSVPGVRVLDVSSDLDHNRTVVTCVGDATAVEAGAFSGIAKAAELIDMEQHSGAHPRIGATDVVPFVPIRQATLADCITLACRLGERVGQELKIPVYLYEAAATRPERKNLETLRRGQYERLKAEILSNPDRQPDFGPSHLGKAGATVIGARPFLIAYNVFLNTSDPEIAKKIARAVRHSSGGLRYVKALGLLVAGRAQVSMNLTDFEETPIARVVELIRREAARYGAGIGSAEVIGLIPQAALTDAARWYLQLDGLRPEQILEQQLAALEQPPRAAASNTAFLDELAAGTATPGGGAAAAYSGAMSAALVAMVARLTIGNKRYAEVIAKMEKVWNEAEMLRAALTASVAADCAAFDAVMQAYQLPRGDTGGSAIRATAIEQALHRATVVPLRVAHNAARVMELAAIVAEHGNLNAVGEAGSAAHLALTAVRSAALNVHINAVTMKSREHARQWLSEIAILEDTARAMSETIHSMVRQRLVRPTPSAES